MISSAPIMISTITYGKNKIVAGEISLFIDGIRKVEDWEKCVASLLGSELATLLSGRYIEFPIYSLGLNEFVQFMGREEKDAVELFPLFLKFGGFPALHHFDLDQKVVNQYISSFYNTIFLKDVIKRHRVRNIVLLENITMYNL